MKDLKESASVKEFRESNFRSFNHSQGSLQVQGKVKPALNMEQKQVQPSSQPYINKNAELQRRRVDEKL